MLLIREVGRLVLSLLRFSLRSRNPLLLVVVVLVAVAALTATSVTVIGPVVLYPFV
jgi:hypothetical protein